MATQGLAGDVNNSISLHSAYPEGGRDFGYTGIDPMSYGMRNDYVSELGALNQDYASAMSYSMNGGMNGAVTNGAMARNGNNTTGKQPAAWWLTFAIVFIIVAWLARKFSPDGEQFAIIRPNLINGVFVTLWIVLILVFLKQVALRIQRVPFLSALAKMILSV